jgi:HPt (histidine-containing phosphotransfer) domain-containing protein
MQVPVDLKIRYLSRRLEDIPKLRQALDEEDFSYALMVGHQVKGNAVTFDVPQMAHVGLEMEKAALKKDKEKVKILIEKMEAIIQSVKATY